MSSLCLWSVYFSDPGSSQPRLFHLGQPLQPRAHTMVVWRHSCIFTNWPWEGLGVHMGIPHIHTPWERQSYLVQQTEPQGKRDPGDPSDFVAEIREWSLQGCSDSSAVFLSMGVKPEWGPLAWLIAQSVRLQSSWIFLCCGITIRILKGTSGIVWLTYLDTCLGIPPILILIMSREEFFRPCNSTLRKVLCV